MPAVVCPTCEPLLDVAAADMGLPVQCVTCQQTFVARWVNTPRRERPSDDDPDAGYRPPRGTCDADYERRYGKPRHGLGVASLTFGIFALVTLCLPPLSVPFALLAIVLGAFAQRTEGKRRGLAGLGLGVLALLVTGGVVLLSLLPGGPGLLLLASY